MELPYEDVYVLTIPFAPPLELCHNLNVQQQEEMGRLFDNPTAMHVLRLKNQSDVPLTTAPALIVESGQVLGQGLIHNTSVGNSCDLDVTAAVNIKAKSEDQQEHMTPHAMTWNGSTYSKVQMSWTLSLLNYSDKVIHLEVKRQVLGWVDQAGQEAHFKQTGKGFRFWNQMNKVPVWWGWCNWTWWCTHINSMGVITWDIHLKSHQQQTLDYTWHYFCEGL